MKFSVLLPTRNRLAYLKQAIETVRRQDYDDWEVIVSDNHSEEDIEGYVRSIGDGRVKYFRTERFLPVTDNWNNALAKSTGDYIIMLGDDDGLLQRYFSTSRRLIEAFEHPDVLYTGAYLFTYPGAVRDKPTGSIRPYGYAGFLQNAQEPFLLDRGRAIEVAKEILRFRVVYGFNVQFYLVRRKFVDSLRAAGPFYQSAFPDYYATNVAFLKAERILVCPSPMVVIGICPKSYGAYYNSNRESQGVHFLAGERISGRGDKLKSVTLPGSNINTSWLSAAEAICDRYGSEFDLRVDYDRYRRLQTLLVVRECLSGLRSPVDLWRLARQLRADEWPFLARLLLLRFMRRTDVAGKLEREMDQFISYEWPWEHDGVKDMATVFEHASPSRYEYS